MGFEEQLERVHADAVRYARGLSGSVADGDDLLQEALLHAWKAYPQLRDPARFRYWLLRIIGNTHRTWARRMQIRRWFSLDHAAEIPARGGLAFEEKEIVRQALRKVPRVQRQALVLFEVLGMSVEEIANVQKATPSAVKSRLSRGRMSLRDAYHRLSRWEDRHAVKIVEAG